MDEIPLVDRCMDPGILRHVASNLFEQETVIIFFLGADLKEILDRDMEEKASQPRMGGYT